MEPSCELKTARSPQVFSFFLVGHEALTASVYSDYTDQVWTWDNEDGMTFYFDIGEVVRFRVETETWHDQVPNAPDQADTVSERKPPYSVIVSSLLFYFYLSGEGWAFLRLAKEKSVDKRGRVQCRWLAWGLFRGGHKSDIFNHEERKHEDRCGG